MRICWVTSSLSEELIEASWKVHPNRTCFHNKINGRVTRSLTSLSAGSLIDREFNFNDHYDGPRNFYSTNEIASEEDKTSHLVVTSAMLLSCLLGSNSFIIVIRHDYFVVASKSVCT